MGLLVDTARAAITSLKRRANDLAATALLEQALRELRAVAGEHWRVDGLADVPEMIQELARDREDFRKMAAAYREDLARVESELRTYRLRYADHESWCDVFSTCTCCDLDEDDP